MSIHDIAREIRQLHELLNIEHQQTPKFVTRVVSTEDVVEDGSNIVGDDELAIAFGGTAEG